MSVVPSERVLVLGATGRTGKWVLYSALKEGYEVNCLVRNAKKIETIEGVKVFEGDVLNVDHVLKAMEGCSAMISVLNISRTWDFPWAKLRTPNTFLSEVMSKVAPLLEGNGTHRVVLCSAWGVLETKKDVPKWFQWLMDYSNIGVAYRDHERQEHIVVRSSLDWTIVRSVGLTNSTKSQEIRVSSNNQPKPKMTIGRKAVGHFMVKSLKNRELIGRKVVISSE
ncbi:MAG: NAD(P)-dependent oxidoreductase [Flavobacteriaceae bacterium]